MSYLLVAKGTQNHPHIVFRGSIVGFSLNGRSKNKAILHPVPGVQSLRCSISAPNENAASFSSSKLSPLGFSIIAEQVSTPILILGEQISA
ncbi:hypothetical protein [Alistipes sp.]|uniref:hypothetical protein n=1 Tax=Alistipes sp. TaxID=1872444 RepID=UPI003AF06D59